MVDKEAVKLMAYVCLWIGLNVVYQPVLPRASWLVRWDKNCNQRQNDLVGDKNRQHWT